MNPVLLITFGAFATGWVLIAQFIFTLALALRCYPLQQGGLLAIEAVLLGMTSPEMVYQETVANFDVILLLMFMVAGIYFMKELLLFLFTRILLGVRSKVLLSLLFSLVAAFLSAFLDALTVTAVLISVGVGFYSVYHKVASGQKLSYEGHDHSVDHGIGDLHREDLEQFRAFLRSLLMHAAVGTAPGGETTSMISDNAFVATVYITEVKAALDAGTLTRQEFDHLAVAINAGTNLPSVATTNGQAAFLFLLTSALAPLIRLS